MALIILQADSLTAVPNLKLSVRSTCFMKMNKGNDNTKFMAPSKKNIAFILANLLFYAGPLLFAQLPDGTRSTVGWIEEIKKNRIEEENLDFNEALVDQTVSFSVIPYVIRDVNGM